MSTPVTLTLTDAQYGLIRRHLFPGDGKEAAVIALCGHRCGHDRQRLVVRELHPVPYDVCTVRRPDAISWPVDWLDPLLNQAAAEKLSVVKFHSHPADYRRFSAADNASDASLFPGIHAWVGQTIPHASVVMLVDGALFGRTVDADGLFSPLQRIMCVGDDIRIWHGRTPIPTAQSLQVGRPTPAFGHLMTAELGQLSAAIVGCSGTGSIVVEQIARLGFGRMVLVDPEVAEFKNMNRIVNSTWKDATSEVAKVEIARRAIQAMQLGTIVETYPTNIVNRETIEAVAGCDILFGCVDSAEGRDVLSRISTYYLLPYIDVGVRIGALPDGRIDQIDGVVHYIKPGGSSLLSRQAYRQAQVAADALRRTNPKLYEERQREKYIEGTDEEAPAVISVNMTVAAMAVNEMLGRIYLTRNQPNARYATTRINLAEMEMEIVAEGAPCPVFAPGIGAGDIEPLLNLPELSV